MGETTMKSIEINGKTIQFEVLSEEEMRILLTVPTTVGQARRIKQRNLALLQNAEKDKFPMRRIGCPHCKFTAGYGHECKSCAWSVVRKEIRKHCKEAIYSLTCIHMTFGGVDLDDSGVVYSTNDEYIMELSWSEKTKNFLRGHIEWADAVIALRGIPWPNGKITVIRPQV